MSCAKLALAITLAALSLSACGTIDVKPTTSPSAARGRIDDPRSTEPDHVKCLQKDGLTVSQSGSADLTVGSGPSVIHVHFEPTPGAAQGVQMQGADQGAEVIGGALLYPGQASDQELTEVEKCVASGVKG